MVIFKKIIQVLIHPDVHQMPVIESGPLDRLVGDIKAERLDQMQHTARRRTGPGNVAGICRDLRFDQNNVQHGSLSA